MNKEREAIVLFKNLQIFSFCYFVSPWLLLMNKEMLNSEGYRFHLEIIPGDLVLFLFCKVFGLHSPFPISSLLLDVNPATNAGATKRQSPATLFRLVQKHNYSSVAQAVCYGVAAQWMKPQKMREKISSITPASSQFTVCLRGVSLPNSLSLLSLLLLSPQLLISCQAAQTWAAGILDKSPLGQHLRSVYFSSVLCVFGFVALLKWAQFSCSGLNFWCSTVLRLYINKIVDEPKSVFCQLPKELGQNLIIFSSAGCCWCCCCTTLMRLCYRSRLYKRRRRNTETRGKPNYKNNQFIYFAIPTIASSIFMTHRIVQS